MSEGPIQPFNYGALDPTVASALQDAAQFIQERLEVTQEAMLQVGYKLIEIKAAYPGQFQTWVQAEFPLSLDSAEKWMQVARNMGGQLTPANINHLHTRALFLLAANVTSTEARQWALQRANEGQTVNHDLAWIASRAPIAVRQRFETGELSEQQAVSLGKALIATPAPVMRYAIQTDVTDPDVVKYLSDAYTRHLKARPGTDTSWTEIQHNAGALVINEEVVPLKIATGRDCDHYNEWRQWGHRQAGTNFLYKKQSFKVGTDGTLVLPNLPPGTEVKVTIWS